MFKKGKRKNPLESSDESDSEEESSSSFNSGTSEEDEEEESSEGDSADVPVWYNREFLSYLKRLFSN